MENNVFSRTAADGEIVSDSNYNLIIGLVLAWGFFLNYLIVKFITFTITSGTGMIVFILLFFASSMIGSSIMHKSNNPVISFLGYNLIAIPFGFIVNLVVQNYSPTLVQQAMLITGIVTVVMMMAGTMFPAIFQKIQGALTIALISVIVIQLVTVFIFKQSYGIFDWIVAIIFCGYIGYDWGRANRIPKTVDNAIDSAAALYMDIINLFLRILRILGRRK